MTHEVTIELPDDSVLSDWYQLYQRLPVPRFYHHPDWCLAINSHLLPTQVSVMMLKNSSGRCDLIVPLMNGINNTVHGPNHDHLSLNGILFDPDLSEKNQLDALSEAMDRQLRWHSWHFHNVPLYDSLANATQSLLHTRADRLWTSTQSRETAWFDLTKDSKVPSGKLKRNLRRLRKQLLETSPLRFEQVTNPAQLDWAFEQFLNVEASGWKGAEGDGTAIKHSDSLRSFYASLLTPRYKGLTPTINLLFADELCIAAQYGLATKNCLSLLKIGYLEDYSHYSPGSLLLEDVINQCYQDKTPTLSLVTSPPWAVRWHPETAPVWHITRYNNTTFGHSKRMLHAIKDFTKARLRPAR
ncbi:MAG: GNAT family N-acetyltransferase [Gammaproteobacteria bacterium]|nr:GNAT family N-acetyltransferase [Gammaproteobacteria bacterium]